MATPKLKNLSTATAASQGGQNVGVPSQVATPAGYVQTGFDSPHSVSYWANREASTPQEALDKFLAFQSAGYSNGPIPKQWGGLLTESELALLKQSPAYSGLGSFDSTNNWLPNSSFSDPNVGTTPAYVAGGFGVPSGSGLAASNPSLVSPGGGASGGGPVDPTTALLQQMFQYSKDARADNQKYIDNSVAPIINNNGQLNVQDAQSMVGNVQNMLGPTLGYIDTNNKLVQQGYDVAGWGNAQDAANLAQLQGTYNGMHQLTASPYVGDAQSNAGDVARQAGAYNQLAGIGGGALNYSSQGAQAYANPGDVATEQRLLGSLEGVGNGSLDYSSQAALAYADPASLARQQSAYQGLDDAVGGSLSVDSKAAKAFADPRYEQAQVDAATRLREMASGSLSTTSLGAQAYADPNADAQYRNAIAQLGNWAGGSHDLTSVAATAQADPAALAAQRNALSQYGALTSPQVTAQERFIYEQARQKQEQDEQNSRGAVMNDLRARGMSGSGMELTNMLGLQQQQSQNRLLSDLGAQSNAVNRSMQALQGYGGLSSTMADQSFARDFATKGATDAMNVSNRNTALQSLALYTDASGQLRSQTFDEAYKRGLAGDQTAIANANRMLQAAGMSSDAAAALRNASFSEEFARGQAYDQTWAANNDRMLSALGMRGQMSTDMRNESFNEAYQRGVGADTASANNQRTQLSGLQSAGGLSADMRNQGFNEAYSRGMAADSAAAHNQQTQLSGSLGAAQTAGQMRSASDQMAQFNKTQQMLTSQFQDKYASDQQLQAWGRATDLSGAQTTATNNTVGRSFQAINAGGVANDKNLGAGWQYTGQLNGATGGVINARDQSSANALAIGALRGGQNIAGLGPIIQTGTAIAGDAAAQAAAGAVPSDNWNLFKPQTWF